ncbi:unnamed protein product [Amoebophrya sp. A120]|nr:unnamed protein product [Amoebophrya sp. A120]|eukprot:GSA120T00022170001.1
MEPDPEPSFTGPPGPAAASRSTSLDHGTNSTNGEKSTKSVNQQILKYSSGAYKEAKKISSKQDQLQLSLERLSRAFQFYDAERCTASFLNGSSEPIWVYSYNRAVGTSAPGSTTTDNEPHSKMLLHPREKSKISAFDGESKTCESFRVWLKNDKSWLTRNSAWHFISNVKMPGSGRLELVMLTLDSKKICIA